MNKRDKSKVQSVPFPNNKNIHIEYEIRHGRDTIVPGDKITFKNVRGKFKFVKLVINPDLEVSWIDCIDEKTHTFRSFYTDRLRSKVKPKKPRKSKVV